ncbi:MAG: chemotaxis protein CheD [Methanolinea sp.]|nr:chemotaxis protein CheD [Methanolinea sp.]
MPPPDESLVIVGIGEYHVGNSPMSTIGLGSCIGLVLHDTVRATGGLVHIMLPDSQGRMDRPGKYADSAVELLVKELIQKGCKPSSLIAKMVGGAAMFRTTAGSLNIGERNIEAVKIGLKSRGIPISGEDVGGSVGRTITYYPQENGKILVKIANGTLKTL